MHNLSACSVSKQYGFKEISWPLSQIVSMCLLSFNWRTGNQEWTWNEPSSKWFSFKIWTQKSSLRWPVKMIRWHSDWSCNMSGSPALYPAKSQSKLDLTGMKPLGHTKVNDDEQEKCHRKRLLQRQAWPLSRTIPFLCQGSSQTKPCSKTLPLSTAPKQWVCFIQCITNN